MKKYLTDNFGYTLRNIRENLKLTQTEVFQGILARSTWCNYESEMIIPDMITFITLLERMGVSSNRFEFIVPDEVHKFYTWYEECLFYIENKDWKGLIDKRNDFKVLKQINVKIQCQYRDFIDYVIERFAYKNLDKALLYIRQALLYTITDIDNIVTNRALLSIFEGHLLSNYYDLLYIMQADDDITKKLYLFYEYYSHRLKDDLIKGKIIPRIALILLIHDKNLLSVEKRLEIEHTALDILVKNHSIREVPEILKYLIEDEMSYGMSKIRTFQRIALVSIFDKYGVCPDFRVEVQRFERKKHLLLSDMLKLRRIELGMTLEEVSGDICAVSTYARAENGKVTPNKTTLALLKERLELRALYYSSEIETEDYSTLILNSECRKLISLRMHDEAIIKCKELSEKLDMNILVNKRIVGFYKLYKSLGKADSTNALWNLLLYTDIDFDHKFIFSREELELLSCIAREKAKVNSKDGILFLEKLLEKESKQRGTYYLRTAIISRDLIKMLKDNKEYERSYELVNQVMGRMLKENEGGLLLDMLDYISTIKEETGLQKEASEICKNMFYVAELYEMYDDAKSIKKYYTNNFNKNEVWY